MIAFYSTFPQRGVHYSVEIAEILSHAFLQKFRESIGFTKEITK